MPGYYYKVETRIKNGLLVQLMKIHNLSARQLAKETGISYTKMMRLINLQESPCLKRPGKYGSIFTPTAEKLAKYFFLTPQDIFPSELWKPLETNRFEKYVHSKSEAYFDADSRRILKDILDTLTPQERDVIKCRFGFDGDPMTLRDIGREFNVGHERIRQIEAKALRKLRHPSRLRLLGEIHRNADDHRAVIGHHPAFRVGL